jgi:hypothetical protein
MSLKIRQQAVVEADASGGQQQKIMSATARWLTHQPGRITLAPRCKSQYSTLTLSSDRQGPVTGCHIDLAYPINILFYSWLYLLSCCSSSGCPRVVTSRQIFSSQRF